MPAAEPPYEPEKIERYAALLERRAVAVRRGLTLASIPAAGEQVLLRDTGNISTGGVARDVTDVVHPAVRSICERAARTIGLDICGLDLIMPHIAQPFTARSGIIEVNAGPGIRMHHHPQQGTPRNVGKAIVGMLYKIIPFLVWYKSYSRQIGRAQVPALAELYSGRWQVIGYWAYLAGLAVTSVGIVSASAAAVRVGTILLALSVATLLLNVASMLLHLVRPKLQPVGTPAASALKIA